MRAHSAVGSRSYGSCSMLSGPGVADREELRRRSPRSFAHPAPCMQVTCVPGCFDVLQVHVEEAMARARRSPERGRIPASPTSPCRPRRRARRRRRRSRRAPPAASARDGSRARSARRASRSTATAPSRSRWTTSPTPAIRSTSRSFARRHAAVRSSAVAPMLPARLTTRTSCRARASRAMRDVLGRGPAPVEMREPEVDRVEPDRRDPREEVVEARRRRSRAARTPRSLHRRTGPIRSRRRTRARRPRSSRS